MEHAIFLRNGTASTNSALRLLCSLPLRAWKQERGDTPSPVGFFQRQFNLYAMAIARLNFFYYRTLAVNFLVDRQI